MTSSFFAFRRASHHHAKAHAIPTTATAATVTPAIPPVPMGVWEEWEVEEVAKDVCAGGLVWDGVSVANRSEVSMMKDWEVVSMTIALLLEGVGSGVRVGLGDVEGEEEGEGEAEDEVWS